MSRFISVARSGRRRLFFSSISHPLLATPSLAPRGERSTHTRRPDISPRCLLRDSRRHRVASYYHINVVVVGPQVVPYLSIRCLLRVVRSTPLAHATLGVHPHMKPASRYRNCSHRSLYRGWLRSDRTAFTTCVLVYPAPSIASIAISRTPNMAVCGNWQLSITRVKPPIRCPRHVSAKSRIGLAIRYDAPLHFLFSCINESRTSL